MMRAAGCGVRFSSSSINPTIRGQAANPKEADYLAGVDLSPPHFGTVGQCSSGRRRAEWKHVQER